ncbi:MAG: hypothetical protein GY809_14710 [Planctomycetes bacterium]|nr:hypothetical protein [Planctomycetota bacterium]
MNRTPYKRQPGDYEIRLLKDGRMVLVGPDQSLLEIAKELSEPTLDMPPKERTTHDSGTTGSASATTSQDQAKTQEQHE